MVVDLADSDLIPVLVVGELAGPIKDLEAVAVECHVFLAGPQILDLDLMGLALAGGPWERSAFGRSENRVGKAIYVLGVDSERACVWLAMVHVQD